MTAETFRSSPERVGKMRELLNDPTLAEAIVCLQDSRPESDLDHLTADALVSVRVLNRQIGYDRAINLLLSLAAPLPIPEPEERPTWGVNTSQFQQPA